MAKTAKKEKKSSKESGILKIDDIRGKTPDELTDLVLSFKKDQFNTRFMKLSGETQKSSRTRKNIARIKTVQNQLKKQETVKKPANKPNTKKKVSKNA